MQLMTRLFLVLLAIRAVLSLKPNQITKKPHLDWNRVTAWGEGYLAARAVQHSASADPEFIDESECESWQHLFFIRGWNTALKFKMRK